MTSGGHWTDPYPDKVAATFADGPSIDAFGRLRVAGPTSLFDSQLQYDEQPLLWVTKSAGTASQTHRPDESAVDMTLGTASGDRFVRQTREYFRYQPGKSQLVKCTGTFGAAQVGTEKLIGYGDDNNGIFMGQDGGGSFVLLRSSVTGSVSDARKVYQADWNVDKMDGTGPSGVTLDATKAQIVLLDIEWLGVGRVRIGFVQGGAINYVHEFLNANIQTTTYMTTGNLPIRYEIKNTDAVSSAPTLKHICSEVESEGGQEETVAYPFSEVREDVSIPNGFANAQVIFAARHASTFNGIENRVKFTPTTYEVLATGSDTVFTRALYNITPTGTPTWTAVNGESAMEGSIDIGSNYTNGLPVAASMATGGGNNKTGPSQGRSIAERLPFGLDIDGANPVIMCVVAWANAAGMTASFVLNWEELR